MQHCSIFPDETKLKVVLPEATLIYGLPNITCSLRILFLDVTQKMVFRAIFRDRNGWNHKVHKFGFSNCKLY